MASHLHDVSRRGFLAVSGVAWLVLSPLRKLLHGADDVGEADPSQPPNPQAFSLTGGSTDSSFITTSIWADDDLPQVDIGLSYSTSPSMFPRTNVTAKRVDGDGLVRHLVSGLTSNQRYYCQLTSGNSHSLFGPVFQSTTRPSGSGAYEIELVLGSCLANKGAAVNDVAVSEIALSDAYENIAQRGGAIHLHLGDWGYWGQDICSEDPADYTRDLSKYIQASDPTRNGFTYLQRILHSTNLEGVCISDHELEINGDEDSCGSGGTWQAKSEREMTAFRRLFPIPDSAWGDRTSDPVHRGYYVDLSPHVRLVVSDLRSPERETASGQPDLQMWGATQEAWLFEDALSVAEDQVILFVNETSWWRSDFDDLRATDKPAAYPAAQDRFVARLKGTGDYSMYDAVIDRFVWLGGDRHYCGYSDGSALDGFPQFIGSGWFKDAVALQTGESMDWMTPTPRTPRKYDSFPVAQYMHLVLSYDPDLADGQLALSGRARYAESTHRVMPRVSTTAGSAHITTTRAHLFSEDDIGRTITGRFIPVPQGKTDSPATIVSVAADGRSAELSVRAVRTKTFQGTVIYQPTDWTMVDHPSIGATRLAWTVR